MAVFFPFSNGSRTLFDTPSQNALVYANSSLFRVETDFQREIDVFDPDVAKLDVVVKRFYADLGLTEKLLHISETADGIRGPLILQDFLFGELDEFNGVIQFDLRAAGLAVVFVFRLSRLREVRFKGLSARLHLGDRATFDLPADGAPVAANRFCDSRWGFSFIQERYNVPAFKRYQVCNERFDVVD